MPDRVHLTPELVYPVGSQVVVQRPIVVDGWKVLHPQGAVGVIVRGPIEGDRRYRVRFLDGVEEGLAREELVLLAQLQEGDIGDARISAARSDLMGRLIFRCITGSRAFGLDDEASDTDYRGVYLPPAELQWSLYGVPEQIERYETQEHYWELQRFLVLALKANPNVLECLYTPLIDRVTPLGEALLAMRETFLSRMVYQTYNGYVLSQFKKMQADLRNQGKVKWKHVMHLLRLLLSGIRVLREGLVPVRVEAERERLLAIKRGEVAWEETEAWRLSLHADFDRALQESKLPERPDYERANAFLLRARRAALEDSLP